MIAMLFPINMSLTESLMSNVGGGAGMIAAEVPDPSSGMWSWSASNDTPRRVMGAAGTEVKKASRFSISSMIALYEPFMLRVDGETSDEGIVF